MIVTDKSIALSLSGGGVRGVAHIGVIRAISEAGYSIRALAGCSFGAVVAVAYAAGADLERIPELIPKFFSLRNLRPGFGRGGLITSSVVINLLDELQLPHRLEDLPIPVTINATDLVSGRAVYFSSGPLATLVSASCCLPGLMTPVQYEGMVLVDGGVLDVLPTDPLKKHGLPIWAIHTNAYPAGAMPAISARMVLERMGQLVLCRQAQAKRGLVDRYFEPQQLGYYRMMDWHLARRIAEEGYAAVSEDLRTKSEE